MTFENHYIPRNLSWIDGEQKKFIGEDSLLKKFPCPLVILGDPGMGKTQLMEKLGTSDGCRFIRATSFLRQVEDSTPESERLIIDGLDEVAAMEEGDPLHNVLKKLIACGKPSFVISCRVAEWRGVTARFDIENEYGQTPEELCLESLSEMEAVNALALEVDQERAEKAIRGLSRAGLSGLFKNPLTLKFVTAIVKEEGSVPETRAELYECAVTGLSREVNPNLSNSTLAKLSENDVLNAAGQAMATMLITGRDGIAKGRADESMLLLSDISGPENFETTNAVLGSNLFRADTLGSKEVNRFMPLHRTVAEFLGARWLAYEVETKGNPNRVTRRLLGLISAEGGVPASLRGLHAWLPKFSPERLGPKAINQDPYGILRYGDGANLSSKQARQILRGVRQLAAFDPFFRDDWWDGIPLQGLAHPALLKEIRSIICDSDEPMHLRSLLLDAINGSEIAKELKPELENIMLDADRIHHERYVAGEAIHSIRDSTFDWVAALTQLAQPCDADSTRLTIELACKIGTEKLNEKLITRIVVAHAGILDEEAMESGYRADSSLSLLAREISISQIKALLDELTKTVAPLHDPENWWDKDSRKGWTNLYYLSDHLISRQLQHDSDSVESKQLWEWMRSLWSGRDTIDQEHKIVANVIRQSNRLRVGVQRLALFVPGTEDDFYLRNLYLQDLSEALSVTKDDARIHLSEVVARGDPVERKRWMALVELLRGEDHLIPKDIQKMARPFAEGDKELMEFLTKKPKRQKLSESEKKWRRRVRDRKRRKQKNIEKARAIYAEHLDEMRRGEFKWIFDPARAYLGLFSDFRKDGKPSDRVADWLGDDVRDAALIGFEAVLHRDDLPSTKQIAESYANSQVWNIVKPMLAGACERYLKGQGFEDLSTEVVSTLAMAVEHEFSSGREQFDRLQEVLDAQLQVNLDTYEVHIRQKFEPMLATGQRHIVGLYQFARQDAERPLSTQLSLEWLESFPDLPFEVLRELTGCIIHATELEKSDAWPKLATIAKKRLAQLETESDEGMLWQSLQFLLDFETASKCLPDITLENRDFLWKLTNSVYDRYENKIEASLISNRQLEWIVSNFRCVWPYAKRPNSVTVGFANPWDATELLTWAIRQIAMDPSNEAAQSLERLRNMPHDDYTVITQAAMADNQRKRLEARFKSPSIHQLRAVLDDQEPQSATDVQSIVLDQLSELQARLQGDELNVINNFYDDNGKPKTEPQCRDQMLIALGKLPFEIQPRKEAAMPQDKRVDTAFVFGNFEVPLETKGQWHREVWTAASTQLDQCYTVAHKSASKGIYVVFWFGEKVPAGKRLKLPPDGVPRPQTAKDMCLRLQALLPEKRRSDIAIYVLDLTR
ncbi:MAG: hypothetical protein OXG06_03340 [Gammaproteobacteria bacterium]|nr:hypothetical protein [Gammaproteobacteria bacterium]